MSETATPLVEIVCEMDDCIYNSANIPGTTVPSYRCTKSRITLDEDGYCTELEE